MPPVVPKGKGTFIQNIAKVLPLCRIEGGSGSYGVLAGALRDWPEADEPAPEGERTILQAHPSGRHCPLRTA